MKKINVYNKEGNVVKEINLNDEIFNIKIKPEIVHEVVVAQLANFRTAIADTKDRGEVRGGGKKPWKQKGTGRARQGSIRSPLWIGGGVTFGPLSIRNFSKKVNRKVKTKALFMTLTDKAANEKMVVVDSLDLPEIKTKIIKDIISKLPLQKKVLVVLPKQDQNVIKSTNNLKNIKVILADSLNVYDILNSDSLLLAEESLNKIQSVYLKGK